MKILGFVIFTIVILNNALAAVNCERLPGQNNSFPDRVILMSFEPQKQVQFITKIKICIVKLDPDGFNFKIYLIRYSKSSYLRHARTAPYHT